MSNRNVLLISGKSAAGKTVSLRNLDNPKGVIYLCCEAGKRLPFKAPFKQETITDPLRLFTIFDEAEKHKNIHTIVIDTLTYLMDMYESLYVLTASGDNKFKAWSDYAQYFKKLMQQYVAKSTKNIIFLAHTSDILNEGDHVMETMVKVKGALMNQGIESYFNNVITSKKIALSTPELAKNDNPLFTINDEEEIVEFKYVFQTRLTKKTVNERIRGPIGMWGPQETFIDNDLQNVINRLHEYYDED